LKKLDSLSIVLPCYNEYKYLPNVVKSAHEVANKITDLFEIIIINDGSTDQTYNYLKMIDKDFYKLKIINRKNNLGVGSSLIEGFRTAKYEYIFFNSSDEQAPMDYLFELSNHIYSFDIVFAFYPDRKDNVIRRYLSKIYHEIINYFFGIKITNVNAMKLFKRGAFFSDYQYNSDYSFDFHFLYLAIQNNFSFTEIPFKHVPREGSKSSINWFIASITTFISIIKFFIGKK